MLGCLVFLKNIDSKNKIYLNLLNSNKHINLYYHLIGTNIIYNKKVKLEIEKIDSILQHFNIDFVVVKINNNYIYEMNELINKIKISKVINCFTDVSLELTTNDSANYLRLHNNCKINYIYETLQLNSKVNVSNVKRLPPSNISKAPNISKELSNFGEICMSFLECLEDVQNKQISKNSIYESVYIEFRELKHSEFIIKNCIIKLNEKWSHTVICCNDNYDFTVNLCNKINKNINIIKLDITNATYNDYNNLLLTKNFWNNLKGTKILLYQSDSLIFNTNVDDFLHYDYIGIPFTRKCILAKSQVGNGGLSLRSKNVMLDVLNNPKCDKMYSRIAENFRLHFKFDNIPEDIYFSQNIQNLELGLVADEEVGKKFGFLNKYENCFGMHAIWQLCGHWKDIIINHMKNTLDKNNSNFKINTNENIKVVDSLKSEDTIKITEKINMQKKLYLYDNTYVKSTEHRGGWKSIINILQNRCLSADNTYSYLIDLPAITFLERKKIIKHDFFMIIHETINILPNIGYQVNVSSIMNNYHFNQSLSYCKGIITFSQHVRDNIISYNKNIPVISIKHPTETLNIKLFDLKKINFDNCNVILLGSQLRSVKNIYLLKTQKPKCFLPGTIKYKDIKIKQIKDELNYYNIAYENNKLHTTYFNSFEEYDNFIISNIIIIDLVDANANNSVCECIVRNIPFFVNKLNAVIEYLGFDYPMYFTSKEDLESIINDNTKLFNLYEKTNIYLEQLNKTDLNLNFFESEFFNFIQNTSYNAVNLFPIYFPQFHEFYENNINFYEGFDDYKNLIDYNNSIDNSIINDNKIVNFRNHNNEFMNIKQNDLNVKLDTCDLNFYGEKEYNLEKTNLINKQVKLASMYGFKGFGLYYYYFSNNDDRENLIMKNVINKFFENNFDNFNIYFIWCNENWSNSVHFTNNTILNIVNTYSENDIIKQFKFLIKYFKHNNYYKINNKPVFAIHFPELVDDIVNFWELGNNICIENGFDGLLIIIKNMNINHDSIFIYNHHCNYKNSWENNYIWIGNIDNDDVCYSFVEMEKYYNKYKINPNEINTLLLNNFNNNPRMFKPFKPVKTFIVNNKSEYSCKYQQNIFDNYKNTDLTINSILHVNSWNEWGESMAIEPSNEHRTEYLDYLNNLNSNKKNINIKYIYLPEHNNWAKVEEYLKIVKSFRYYENNITFIPFFDIYLTNSGKQHGNTLIEAKQTYELNIQKIPTIHDSWIGILHNPFNEPIYKIFLNNYYKIKEHLKTCKGLFCISEQLKKDVLSYLNKFNINIPFVENLYHPISYKNLKEFNIQKFWKTKNVYQIGNWLRKITAIVEIDIPNDFNKYCIPNTKRTINDLYKYNISAEKIKSVNFQTLTDNEYNNLFENSVIFLHLLDSTANNVILECIKSNCPILINKLPSIVEYLGKDYPFYYENYNDIYSLLTYENILKTHNYLKFMNKEKFSHFSLVESIYDTLKKNNIIY